MRIKRIIITSAILLIAGCVNESIDGQNTPGRILSYDYQRYSLVVAEQHSYTPLFDNNGRLVSLDYVESGYDGEKKKLVNIVTYTEKYEYDYSGKTAVATAFADYYNFGEWLSSSEIITTITFDETGRILTTEWDYPSSLSYIYNSGYLDSISSQNTKYIWKNGDLARIINDEQTVDIEYSSEINPFADSVDPVLCSLMPEYYCMGLLGKRTEHLPSSYTITKDAEVKTFLFEYKKDDKGRIEMVKMTPDVFSQTTWRVELHYDDCDAQS